MCTGEGEVERKVIKEVRVTFEPIVVVLLVVVMAWSSRTEAILIVMGFSRTRFFGAVPL